MRIYIDCGAYRGQVFMDNLDKFDKYYLFEANPDLIKYLILYKSTFFEQDIHVYNNAVWKRDEELEFYLSREYQTGSTLMKGKNSGNIDYKTPIKVHAFDFSAWLKRTVKPDDYVYLKMDIEGAEYAVLNKMIKDGTIFLVDEFLIEFHSHKMKHPHFRKVHNDILQFIKENNIKAFHHVKSGQKPV